MPSAFEHDPTLTVPASNTTAKAAVIWSAASNLGESTIILDSGGNGRIGIAGALDVITLTSGTVTVAGAITASGIVSGVGSGLTALNGTQITSGTLPAARIAADSIVEAKLDVSNAPTDGQFLQAQSGEGGGLTWAAATSTFIGCRITNSSSQSITSSGEDIVFAGTNSETEMYDTDNMWSSSNTTRLTFTTAGKYFVNLNYAWDGSFGTATKHDVYCVHRIGGGSGANKTVARVTDGSLQSGIENHGSMSFIIQATAGDYLRFVAVDNGNNSSTIMSDNDSATILQAYKID